MARPEVTGLEISKQFEQFAMFAADALMHGDTKAIARSGAPLAGPDGPRKIEATTEDKVYALKRSQVNKDENDATRELFLKAVADTFKGEKNIPKSVLEALDMKNFKSGKPLTARRIEAVKVAIMREDTKLRYADGWVRHDLLRNGLVIPSQPNVTSTAGRKTITEEQFNQVKKIIAEHADEMLPLRPFVRSRIIDKLLEMVLDPTFAPHAGKLFNSIPRDRDKLDQFKIDDLRASLPKVTANGQHFNITLGKAVQKEISTRLGDSLARADKPDKYPDIGASFEDALTDYARAGSGLKIRDSFVTHVNDMRKSSADRAEMATKIGRFFAEDTVNGERASRIIGDIVHQGFSADILRSIQQAGEPFDFMFGAALTGVMGYSLDRADDGSYQIKIDGVLRHNVAFGKDGNPVPLDAARSKVHVEVNLTLSFDRQSGEPHLVFAQPPTISGAVTPIDCPLSDVTDVTHALISKANLGVPVKAVEFSGEPAKPEFRKAVLDALKEGDDALAKLVSERLVTKDDIELLVNLGIDGTMIDEMIAGAAGDENAPRLEKETIVRLRDPATRDAAVRDIKAMAQKIVDAGWADKVPDIHTEVLNLVTVAGISPVSASNNQSDVKLLMDVIDKSDDQNVRNILADLQSSDPDTVAAAKTRAQNIVREQRQQLGLQLLKSHIRNLGDTQIEVLQKHIPVAQYTEALQHIVNRDSFMDGAVAFFESMIKTAESLEDEAQKIAKYNSYVKVDLFADPSNVARATAKGYTPAELVKINRAANLFMAMIPGITQEQALVEVMTPGYKANRLMGYGGRFLDDPKTFEQGLKLLDDFATWHTDLKEQVGWNATKPKTTVTAFNLYGDVGETPAGLELFVFEQLASDPGIRLSGKPEDIFGMQNNPATRFFGRGMNASNTFTLMQMTQEQREIFYRCTDMLMPIFTSKDGNAKAVSGTGPFVTTRILRHFDELQALKANGQLSAKNVWATCFGDIQPTVPSNPIQTIDTFNTGIQKRLMAYVQSKAGDMTPDNYQAITLYTTLGLSINQKGLSFEEACAFAERGEIPPSPAHEAPFSTDLGGMLDPESGLGVMQSDLGRPTGYTLTSDPTHTNIIPNPRFVVNVPNAAPFEFTYRANIDGSEHATKARNLYSQIKQLCGEAHPRQLNSVLFSMSQGALSQLRGGFPEHGLSSDEHSPVIFTLARDPANGAITIRYDSPPGCPITFNWTSTVGIDGHVTTTPIQITSLPPPPTAAPAGPATVDGTAGAQPSTGETVKSLMDKLSLLMSRAGESSVASVDANELKDVLSGTDIGKRNLKKLDGIARQAANVFARLDSLNPADIGAAYRAGLSDASLATLKKNQKSVYQAAVILRDAIRTQVNLSESLRIVLRGVELNDDQYGAIMEMRLTCDRRISEINSLAEELAKLDATGAQTAAGGRTTLQMLGAKTLEMHGNTDIFEAMKGPAGTPSAADRLSEMLKSFQGRETVLTKQEFDELTRTVNEFNFDLLMLEHAGGVTPNGAKMDKAVIASARGVLGELLSKLEPPLMHGDSLAVSALKDFARRTYSLGDSPLFSEKAIELYHEAGLHGIATALARCQSVREAANAVIDAPWDVSARKQLIELNKVLQNAMASTTEVFKTTMLDFGRIQREGAAILDAASPEAKAAFSPAELEEFKRALAAGDQNRPNFLAARATMLHFNSREIEPLVNHIVDAAERSARLANSATMTGEAVHAIVSGRTNLGTTVELLAHGLGPNDAPPPGIDDNHFTSSAPLGEGGVNSVNMVTYRGEDGVERSFVFKPEASAREGFLTAVPVQGLYAGSQQAVVLNLATQDVADAIGAGDVTVRSFCGICQGEYGTFMDLAKGQSPAKFQLDKVGPDGFSKASLQSLAGKVRAGDTDAIAKSKTLISTFAQKANRLAWLDLITGQLDRHGNNYFISVDEQTGAVDLKAIDNDFAFPGNCIGLNKFLLNTSHAQVFEGKINGIRSKFYPGLSEAQFEAAYGIDAEHGVTRNPDGTITVDLSKFASPIAFIGIDGLGWNCVPVPDEIDEDMYNNLMALDKQADGTPSQGRIEFEKQLRTRLDKTAFDAAMTRLDEAIAAAKDIAAAGRVRKPEYWTSDAVIERAAHDTNLTRESLLPIINGSAPLGLGTMPDGSKAKEFPPLPNGTTPKNIYQEDPQKLGDAQGVVNVASRWTDYMHRDMPEISELADALLQKREGEE